MLSKARQNKIETLNRAQKMFNFGASKPRVKDPHLINVEVQKGYHV